MFNNHKGLGGSWILSVSLARCLLLELLVLQGDLPMRSYQCLLPVSCTVTLEAYLFPKPGVVGHAAISNNPHSLVLSFGRNNCLFSICRFKPNCHLDSFLLFLLSDVNPESRLECTLPDSSIPFPYTIQTHITCKMFEVMIILTSILVL